VTDPTLIALSRPLIVEQGPNDPWATILMKLPHFLWRPLSGSPAPDGTFVYRVRLLQPSKCPSLAAGKPCAEAILLDDPTQ